MKKMLKNSGKVLLIISYLFYSLLGFIPVLLFNMNIKELSNSEELFINAFALSLYLIFILLLNIKLLKRDLFDYKKNYKKYLQDGLKYWLIGLAGMMICNIILYKFIPSGSINENNVQSLITKWPIYISFSAVIFAPLVEELLFRKTIKDLISNKVLFVITSAVLFGLIHVIFNLDNNYQIFFLIPYGIIGGSFALLYLKTNNIWSSIIYHAIHNGILLFLALISNL